MTMEATPKKRKDHFESMSLPIFNDPKLKHQFKRPFSIDYNEPLRDQETPSVSPLTSGLSQPRATPTFQQARSDSARSKDDASLLSQRTVSVLFHSRTASSVGVNDSASQSGYPVRTETTRTTEGRGQAGVILALAEGRGIAHGEIGLATIDLRTSVVALGQYADTASYMRTITKLNVLEPATCPRIKQRMAILVGTNPLINRKSSASAQLLVFPSKVVISETMAVVHSPSAIYTILRDLHFYGGPNIITVQRKHFNEAAGMDLVKKLNLDSNAKLESELFAKYYCLASLAALVSYVEYEHKVVLIQRTLKMKYMYMEDTCLIDCSTVRNLEVLSNVEDSQLLKQCLLGTLDHTKTYAGGRLLRTNLLQPYTKLETIEMRLDCIAELIKTEAMFFGLQQILARFTDVEKVISFLVQVPRRETVRLSESHIGSFIHLKHILGLVEPLRECIKNSKNALFHGFYELLCDERYDEMHKIINVLVHPEVKYEKGTLRMRTQKCYAVKPRINGCLDVARLLYSESVDDISALVSQLAERCNLPLQLGYEATRGFFIQLFVGGKKPLNIANLPEEFIHVTKTRSTYCFTTKEMILLNGRSQECIREVFVLSHEMLKRACGSLRPLIGCLYELTECVATVDVIVSLTHACSLGEYVRPNFHNVLVIEQGRHPVLDSLLQQRTVPNDTYADEGSSFVVITGPNMAGKTTYIKQIALLQIMAQIGSYVPANFASFRVYEQIFSRFGSSDDMQSNASTFMMEMRDMQHICTNANSDTLVLVDELGRGTSPEEGVAICWALCEELLLTGATVFFVTHFEEICDLQHLYPNTKNVHFRTVLMQNQGTVVDKLLHTHELIDGSSLDLSYGLALAEATGLPSAIIQDAARILEKVHKSKFTMGSEEPTFRRQQIVCRYASRLVQLSYNRNLDYNDIIACLMQIRADYMTEMAAQQHQSKLAADERIIPTESGRAEGDCLPQQEPDNIVALAAEVPVIADRGSGGGRSDHIDGRPLP